MILNANSGLSLIHALYNHSGGGALAPRRWAEMDRSQPRVLVGSWSLRQLRHRLRARTRALLTPDVRTEAHLQGHGVREDHGYRAPVIKEVGT